MHILIAEILVVYVGTCLHVFILTLYTVYKHSEWSAVKLIHEQENQERRHSTELYDTKRDITKSYDIVTDYSRNIITWSMSVKTNYN